MKSSKSPRSGQNNTILNYFNRNSTPKTPTNESVENLSPLVQKENSLSTPKSSSKFRSNLTSSTPLNESNSNKKRKFTNDDVTSNEFQLFDVVWAKLSGYPWWPAIICDDPSSGKFKLPNQIHVQFFDDPISHAWVKIRDLKPYTGSVQPGIPVVITDSKLKSALKSAEEALEMKRSERFKMIGDLHLDDYEVNKSDEKIQANSDTPKRKITIESDDSSCDGKKPIQRKRFKKLIVESDDNMSEDEYKPIEKSNDSDDDYSEDDDASKSGELETPPENSDEEDSIVEVKSSKAKKSTNSSKKKQNKSMISEASYSVSNMNQTNNTTQAVTHIEATNRDWPHLNYPFLKPEKIADSQGKKMLTVDGELNPDYDPSTLHVPLDFLNKQTPAIRQWWVFKAKNFDTILFFKMGKFYELFHMDAVIAAKELEILFMRGENAHAGFPEKSYKRYADVLIQKGYKVARIEQTENPKMMEERVKATKGKATKFDKVVKREICRISSIGTLYMSNIDADVFHYSNSYLYSLTCKVIDEITYEFGVCFIDTSIGKFHISQFKDDQQFSKLRTILCHFAPGEIIFVKNDKLVTIIDEIFPNIRKQSVRKFWPNAKTLEFISTRNIWANMPQELRDKILDHSDASQLTCSNEYAMAITSLGGIIEYLDKALIADDLLSMGLFEPYNPSDEGSNSSKLTNYLLLDSVTIKNLEVFKNLRGESASSLFSIINHCQTPFGKRLLHSWLCMPYCNLREEFELRQDAVRELSQNNDLIPKINDWNVVMKNLPDLERLLTQIHTQSSLKRAQDHPDSRAIMFEEKIYKRRRIINFLNTLDGFEKIGNLMEQISELSIQSKLLSKITSYEKIFSKVLKKISFFRNSFDAEKARDQDEIIPAKGVDSEYDESLDSIALAKEKLDKYLKEQSTFFNARVTYVHVGKNRYQLEVPDSCTSKIFKNQEKYEVKGTRKGFKRYHTPTIVNLIAELENAESKRETVLKDIFRRLLERFDRNYSLWSQAIKSVACLDALISLSKTKQTFELHGAVSCLPQLKWTSDKNSEPMLIVEDLRNACLIESRELIANNIELNGRTLILTGPNMAGKTTLMRSVGLMTILAQIGAYVPASKCVMTPVDRIFTRIGAYDQVIESQSTFMVELNETASILHHSTSNSLVLIDELGRGTSTFDGVAIAHAVLEELAQNIRCRCIFSTHFHSIADELMHHPNIVIGHMAYMIENVNKNDPTEEDVVFLYKLTKGVCSQSYGYNVAKMAGIPRDILRTAYNAGHRFELQIESCRLLEAFMQQQKDPSKKQLTNDNVDQLAQYLSEIIIAQQPDFNEF